MTVRTAADALADAVNRAILDGWLAHLNATASALSAYRAATAKAKRVPVVHLSTDSHVYAYYGQRHATGCFSAAMWADPSIVTTDPAAVTCRVCRRSRAFRAAQEVKP